MSQPPAPPPYSTHDSYADIESIRHRYIEAGIAEAHSSNEQSMDSRLINRTGSTVDSQTHSLHDSYAEIDSIRERYIETNIAEISSSVEHRQNPESGYTAGPTRDNPSGTNSYADTESVRYYVNPSLRGSTNENSAQSETYDIQPEEENPYEPLRR